MKFIYSCQTDVGTVRENNQDSLIVKSLNIKNRTMLLAAVCDGVGGLSQGERCSRRAAELLSAWFDYELPQIMEQPQAEEVLRYRFRQVIVDINKEIYFQNCRNGVSGGTTLTALLLWDYRYMIAHVGDSRVYAIGSQAVCLTKDHSWVAQEIAMGRLTPEEAAVHPKLNVILRCIGADSDVEVDMVNGVIQEPTVFVLCTDGFWHYVGVNEWLAYFSPYVIHQDNVLADRLYYMANQVKQRGESDNITSIAIKVF